MTNFRLIGIKLGEGLKYSTSINEINRIASAIFDFEVSSHPHESITSSRSQLIYDWIMTLAEQPLEEERKLQLLQDFINALTSENDPLRNLVGETAKLPELDFWSMVHKDIIRVAKNKFEDGYYADAAESTFKEINKRVKEIVKNKTGEELDGASLMYKAFSEKTPVVILDNLSTETGRNIQKGYMQIFAGVMTGIRNPKAHENITISKERAIHFIFLASLLMYKLDEATY
ncbi:MAG: TIGR02391 family protein [Euryarchaeota archaeon]|nr:TIGR02391 family protein [Euryarchaeota archaeon]